MYIALAMFGQDIRTELVSQYNWQINLGWGF